MASHIQSKYKYKFTQPYQSFWISNSIVTQEEIVFDKSEQGDILEMYPFTNEKKKAVEIIPGDKKAIGWNVDRARAPLLWNIGITGTSDITIASIDTGVHFQHPALAPKYRGYNNGNYDHNYNWWDGVRAGSNAYCVAPTSQPCDDASHGTHTVGSMVGSDANSQLGIAPNIKWIACRSFYQGVIIAGGIENCLQFMLAPTRLDGTQANPDKRPNVIGHSYGVLDTIALQRAYDSLDAAGVVNVAAMGNSGTCGSAIAPAIYKSVVTVSSTDSANALSSFSTKGPGGGQQKPNLAAPGSNIESYSRNGGTEVMSGTSMATPLVAGGIALLMSGIPGLKNRIDLMKEFLLDGSMRIDSTDCASPQAHPNYLFGYGLLDVYSTYLRANQSRKCGNLYFFDANVCSRNGTCNLNAKCDCNNGTFGEFCDKWHTCNGLDPWNPKVCSGFGWCNGTCNCRTGYSGNNCEIPPRTPPRNHASGSHPILYLIYMISLFLCVV